MRIISAELYKLVHKKEFIITNLFFLAFSLLFSYFMGVNSSTMKISGENTVGGAMFVVFIFQFINSFFGLVLVSAIIAMNVWASEFQDGNIRLLIVRTKNRGELFVGKNIIMLIVNITYVLFLTISALVCYELIGSQGEYYDKDIFNIVSRGKLGIAVIYMILLGVLVTSFATFFSMIFKSMKTLLATLGVMFVFKIFERVEVGLDFIPTYLLNIERIFDEGMEKGQYVYSVCVIVIYIVLLQFISYRIFRRRDIA